MTAVPVAAACVDSVLLMRLARDLTRESGIEDAAAMGRLDERSSSIVRHSARVGRTTDKQHLDAVDHVRRDCSDA